MSDPSRPDTPAAEESAPSDPGAPPAPEQPTPPSAEPTVPEAPAPPAAPPAGPAPAPAAPQYVQPYPGAAPVPVAGGQPAATGSPAGPPTAPQPPAAAQPPSPQPAEPTAPLPPYAAASGYPGAPGGYPASPPRQYGAPAGPPGQYGAPAGQYPPPGGAIPPGYPSGSVPPGPGKSADTRPKTLGIIALCLAIGGAVLAFIPLVNLISIPLLIAAIVLAIIALVSKKQGGTGFSIAALIVSVVAGLAAIIVAIVSIFVLTLGGIAAIEDSVPDGGGTIEPYPGEGDADADYGADQDLAVLETAFGDSGDGSWWYAVIIENPNDDAVFDYEDLTVTAVDAGGGEHATNDEYLTILPGTVAIVGYFDGLADAAIADLEVDLPGAEDAYLIDPAELGELTVDDISATADSSTTTVTGTVTSTFSEDAEYVVVSVIARDAAGTIVNAARGYAEAVPAGGSGPFDVLFFPALTDGMTLEAYPAL